MTDVVVCDNVISLQVLVWLVWLCVTMSFPYRCLYGGCGWDQDATVLSVW